jgi:hypothetical protein
MKKVKVIDLKSGDKIIEDNHVGETFLMNVSEINVGKEMTEITIEKSKGQFFKRHMFNEDEVMIK